ncbi:hypothetical protein B566_EDAN001223 [Ephemera danica]|nr:hypothetical protein B566_EDAN001223 [Ephemera danica]
MSLRIWVTARGGCIAMSDAEPEKTEKNAETVQPTATLHGILHHHDDKSWHSAGDSHRVSILEAPTGQNDHDENAGSYHVNRAYESDNDVTAADNGVSSSPPAQQLAMSASFSKNGSATGSALAYAGPANPKEKQKWWVKMGWWPPSVTQISRLVAIIFMVLLVWGIIFILLGHDASPFGGQLFAIAVLCIVAKLGGWVATRVRLPGLLGMLLVGIAATNLGLISIHGEYVQVVASIRRVALTIILIRAGLDLDPEATKKLFGTILKLALGPWLVECCMIAITAKFFLGLPWGWAFMLGSVVAAVSPAVVVPGLLRLRVKGFGVAKGIPTLILAVTGIDDAFSVAAFGVISSILLSSGSLWFSITLGPASVLMGVAFGAVWGNLTRFVPNKDDPYAVHLRVLLLFCGGLLAVFGSDEIGFGGAGPLGVILAAYVSGCIWTAEGWEVEENPVAIAFEVFWLIFEPILFGLTGTQIDFAQLDPELMWLAILCIIVAAAIRIVSTIVIAIGSKLNLKEKIFISFSWMAKATVQAALGPVSLDLVRNNGREDEHEYARLILMVCVLSILLTAPIGAVTIALSGPRLLKRTSPPLTDGWRRHARPSLRDISINDEEELRDSPIVDQNSTEELGDTSQETKSATSDRN